MPRPNRRLTGVYLRYCILIDVCFVLIYGGCNWLAEQRAETYKLYFHWELSIPFVPGMIWGYGSMLVLFFFPLFCLDEAQMSRLGRQILLALPVAGVVFLLFPGQLGFPRPAHVPGYNGIYHFIYLVDYPHNLVPSLHIVFSTLIIWVLMERASAAGRWFYAAWLLVISVSVVLVHQHHLADVLGGYILAWLCRHWVSAPDYAALPVRT